MEKYYLQILETLIIVVVWVLVRFITDKTIGLTLKRHRFRLQRRKIITKILRVIYTITACIFIGAIWGIKQSELVVFLTSVMTVIGIAFFAQWSLLSNISSGLILFFNHPIKLGDKIKILDKDYEIEGEVEDITLFFVHIITPNNEKLTIPTNILLQKTVSVEDMDEEFK